MTPKTESAASNDAAGKVERLAIHHARIDGQPRRSGALTDPLDHAGRAVDRGNARAGLGHREGRAARACGDVEHALAIAQFEPRDGLASERE